MRKDRFGSGILGGPLKGTDLLTTVHKQTDNADAKWSDS